MNKKDELIAKQAELNAIRDSYHGTMEWNGRIKELRKEIAQLISEIEAKDETVVKKNLTTGKDTVIPVKFYKRLSVDQIDAFVEACREFAGEINSDIDFISFSAVARRLQINEASKSEKPEPVSAETLRIIKNQIARDKGYSDWERMVNWIMDHNDSGNTAVLIESAMEEYATLRAAQGKGKEIDLKELVTNAHMAGQHNQGHCDPSYYEALTYYEKEVEPFIESQTPVQSVSDDLIREVANRKAHYVHGFGSGKSGIHDVNYEQGYIDGAKDHRDGKIKSVETNKEK